MSRFAGSFVKGWYHNHVFKVFCFISLQIFFVLLFYSKGFSAEGLKWGRFRLLPELSLSEAYTDNVYLTHTGERDDTITSFSPRLSIDFAIAPVNYFTLRYEGDFRIYAKSDNFKKDIHRTNLLWTLTTPKGSTFKLGAKADFDSIQPYSVKDRHKDFEEKEGFADALFKIGASTDVGIKYSHISERFKDPLYAIDEFDRDSVTLRIVYKRLPVTTPLIEYTFYHQDNNDLFGPSTDMDIQIFLIGTQWEPTAKLSGFLKAGYYKAKLANGGKSSGLAIDTDILYRFSDVTHFKATLFRRLVMSTRAARETGDFYISTGGNVSVSYRRWDPLTMTVDLTYRNNKFKQKDAFLVEDRKDDLWGVGIRAKYSPRDWLSFGLTYRYEMNDTNFDPADYRENRIQVSVTFAM